MALVAVKERELKVADDGGIITERIQNPIRRISDSAMRPVIWRVDADAFK
jgi:hypothetical protein